MEVIRRQSLVYVSIHDISFMHNPRPILNNKAFTDTELKQNGEMASIIEKRFSRWLVSYKLASCLECKDGLGAIDCENSAELNNGKPANIRNKLGVERARKKAEEQYKEIEHRLSTMASKILHQDLIHTVVREMNKPQYLLNEVLRVPSQLNDIISVLFSKGVNYNRLASVMGASNELNRAVLGLVNSQKFKLSVNRNFGEVKDLKTAIGTIGIPGLKYIIPLLVLKPRVPILGTVRARLIEEKLWNFTLYNANANRLLIEFSGKSKDEALDGVVLGSFAGVGEIAIYRAFCIAFEQVKSNELYKLRQSGQRKTYNAMVHVQPNFYVLPELFRDLSHLVGLSITGAFQWDSLPHIQVALQEEFGNKRIYARSHFGVIAKQASVYAKFAMLRKAKMIRKQEVHPYLNNAHFISAHVEKLLKVELGAADYKHFIG